MARPAFTLSDEEELAGLTAENGSHRPQAVFNLDLDYSDDDALLDWEQYAGMSRVRCCGLDCTPLARRLRPPQWWHTYTKRQRRCILGMGVGVALLVALLVALIALAAIRGGSRSMADTCTEDLPPGGAPPAAPPAAPPPAGGEGGALSRKPPQPQPGQPLGSEMELCGWRAYCLPEVVQPKQYSLTLNASMSGTFTVLGEVSIQVETTQTTRCVVLHAADMNITAARLGGPDGPAGHVSWFWRVAEQQLVLAFDQALPQKATLWLAFTYPLREGLNGFYRSTYTLADGKEHSLATTQFEANSARLAFPCFDEPAFKAVWTVEIIAPKEHHVLTNMPPRAVHEHKHNEASGTRTWHFEPTPMMSSYLVCFIIGDFVSTSRSVQAGAGTVNVSVWGTPDRLESLQFAADTAAAVLPAYEKALGVPYALPKLDLVAIPDFSAGAMENWGLVTYRETALLVSNSSSTLDRRYVAVVIAHELAHQWFGNLVTMAYWNELWLNEGFASYFEYLGATAADPAAAFFSTFYTDTVPYAQYFDGKASSHPLSMDAAAFNSTDSVEAVFDAVMYQKGASVLRMLRAWANRDIQALPLATLETVPGASFAKDPFLAALRQYLQAHQFHTTTAADLWAAFKDTLGFDVPAAMQQWTHRQGYPVVTASLQRQGAVHLSQAPFSLNGTGGACDPQNPWWIPISYVTSDQPQSLRWTELQSCHTDEPAFTLGPNTKWVKFNAGQYGFYRVQYSIDGMLGELAAAASTAAPPDAPGAGDANGMLLSGVDLAGLLDDAYSLAEAGQAQIEPFLDLLRALQSRPAHDFEPWAAALPHIYHLERLLPCRADWLAWVGDVLLRNFLHQAPVGGANNTAQGNATAAALQLLFSFTPSEASVPVAQQTVGYRLLRPAILKAAGLFSHEQQAKALNLLAQLDPPEGAPQAQAPPNTIEPDLRSAVYQAAAANGYWEVYHHLTEMYKAATEADEKQRCLLALGYAPGGSNVRETLRLALSADVRAQDVRSLVVTTATHAGPDALNFTWGWLQHNSGAVFKKLGGDAEAARRLAQVIEGVGSLWADPARQAEVGALFAALQALPEMRGMQADTGYAARAQESIAANARWAQQHGGPACAWVKQQAQPVAGGGG